MTPLAAYFHLRNRITALAERLAVTYAAHLRCRRGCWFCCEDITLLPVELEAVRMSIGRDRATTTRGDRPDPAELRASSVDRSADGTFPDVGTGTRCALLDADGACAVYEARPIICRTHGLPLAYRVYEYDADGNEVLPNEPQHTDLWCDLNFTALESDAAVAHFDRHGRIMMAAVNEELELINKAFLKTPAGRSYAGEPDLRLPLSTLRPDV